MMLRTFMTAVIALTLTAAAPADALKFNNTASKIEFVGKKKTGRTTGGFKKFAGTIDAPAATSRKPRSRSRFRSNRFYTDNDKLTGHLKSPDFSTSAPSRRRSSCHDHPFRRRRRGLSHLMTGE